MENNEPPTPAPAPVAEETLEQLKEIIAEKDRQYSEMKAEYEAKFTAMKDASDAQHAEIEQMKTDFAAQLAAKDAELADWERRYAEMRGEFEARNAERDTLAANLRAELAASHAAETANLKARIAELEANAKTAEQIAAEKYGTGTTPINAVPGGKSLAEGLQAAREQGPAAFRQFVKDNRESLWRQ